MVGENELENRLANLDDIRIVRYDLHSLGSLRAARTEKLGRRNKLARLGAARNELPNDAKSATCASLEIGMVAERGDFDIRGLGGGENRGALRNGHCLAVDFKADHFSCF